VDYETGCFLATISFTVLPDIWKKQPLLFEQFLGIIINGLESPQVRLSAMAANKKHSICAAKCFRALFGSQGELSERFGQLATAEFVASIVISNSSPSSDTIELPRLVSTMVDIVQHQKRNEGFSLVRGCLSKYSDVQSVLSVTGFIDVL